MASDPNEALERLMADLRSPKHRQPINPKAVYRTKDVAVFEEAADAIDTLIAKLEGLEREVERLTAEHDQRGVLLRAIDRGAQEQRAAREAAAAQLSALQEALKGIEAGRYENAPDDTLDHPARRIARQALALLLPTVPVEGS